MPKSSKFQTVSDGMVLAIKQVYLCATDSQWVHLGNLPCSFHSCFHQRIFVRQHPGHEAQRARLLRAEGPRRVGQLSRQPLRSRDLRQALQRAQVGGEAHPRLQHREPGVRAAVPDVTGTNHVNRPAKAK
uniref:Uncharacterized protein n=1 Tax=Heterosigma akashiwo TaxID=2829 RepID=A0A7S3YIF8_HETAK